MIFLRDGLITTSVSGSEGDGGDIRIIGPADVIVLDGGFIQANTAAEDAKGGDIFTDAKAVIAEGDQMEVGGSERQIFESGSGQNIIQAAAPDGEHGDISITGPGLDISAALVSAGSGFREAIRLADDPCRGARGPNPSSLTQGGRGGMPPDPAKPLILPFGGERLERLLEEYEKEKQRTENIGR